MTTFPNDEGYDELVLARAIPFRTVCEHHLLPFPASHTSATCPAERILGLSKLARVVEHFAARPQDPGAADQADRRPSGRQPASARGGRRAGRRAHAA